MEFEILSGKPAEERGEAGPGNWRGKDPVGEREGSGERERTEVKGSWGATRKLETRLLLFESTRVLNRSNEVVISALTQRRDALEKEMNRAPAPPRLVVSLSVKSEGLEVRGAKASPSLPPLPGTKPWLRRGKGSRQGEKRSEAFRIKNKNKNKRTKQTPLCTQITDLVPHAPSPLAWIYLETVLATIILSQRLTIGVSMFPMFVQSSLEKYGFLLKKKKIAAPPPTNETRGMDFWSRGAEGVVGKDCWTQTKTVPDLTQWEAWCGRTFFFYGNSNGQEWIRNPVIEMCVCWTDGRTGQNEPYAIEGIEV